MLNILGEVGTTQQLQSEPLREKLDGVAKSIARVEGKVEKMFEVTVEMKGELSAGFQVIKTAIFQIAQRNCPTCAYIIQPQISSGEISLTQGLSNLQKLYSFYKDPVAKIKEKLSEACSHRFKLVLACDCCLQPQNGCEYEIREPKQHLAPLLVYANATILAARGLNMGLSCLKLFGLPAPSIADENFREAKEFLASLNEGTLDNFDHVQKKVLEAVELMHNEESGGEVKWSVSLGEKGSCQKHFERFLDSVDREKKWEKHLYRAMGDGGFVHYVCKDCEDKYETSKPMQSSTQVPEGKLAACTPDTLPPLSSLSSSLDTSSPPSSSSSLDLTDESGPVAARVTPVSSDPLHSQQALKCPIREVALYEHTKPVRTLALSRGGGLLVSGCDDQIVRLWDLKTGLCRFTLDGHTKPVLSVCIDCYGLRIASGSGDTNILLWSASTGAREATIEGHSKNVNSVSFNHDGTQLVSGSSDNSICFWNVATASCSATLTGHSREIWCVRFSHDGSRVVSGSSDQTVRLWNVSAGSCEKTLEGHTKLVCSACFNHDGTCVVSGSADKTVRVWDAVSGDCTTVLDGHTHWVNSVAFSFDGSLVVSASNDRSVRVWNVMTATCSTALTDHGDFVNSACFSEDARLVISASSDKCIRIRKIPS